MARSNLTKEKIIEATIDLAGKIGLSNVSFPRLAEHFDIKAPSLYNHFKNMEEVRTSTSTYLQKELNNRLIHDMVGLNPAESLRAYANVYKAFSEEFSSVFELLNVVRQVENEELSNVFLENIRLIRRSLENFELDDEEIFHRSRMFRSLLHGYITLSQMGYFQGGEKPSKKETFEFMIDKFLEDLV